MTTDSRRVTLGSTGNRAVFGCATTRNNGRYNGNGREWETPPEVFAPLHAEFGFTLDPCATPENAKCPRYFTEAINGLVQSWGTERVFMNPPYGREVYAWARKAREAAQRGALVVGLLPASTDLAWWHEDVAGAAEVRYIRGRVRFLTGGPYRASGFFQSVIVVWSDHRIKESVEMNRKAVVRCNGCGVRLVGEFRADGKLYASRYPNPSLPEESGWCLVCSEAENSETNDGLRGMKHTAVHGPVYGQLVGSRPPRVKGI